MYQDTTATIQAFLNESIRCCEVLQQIFIFNVVNLHHQVLERLEKLLVYWQAKDGEDVSDIRILECLLAPQGKYA
jgi:hypothetical protein